MSLAELSMFGFGWSGIEPVCLYCVDNNLRCSPVIVYLLHVQLSLKQKANKAYLIFDGKWCPVFSSNLIGNVFFGMYFSQRNSS